MTVNQDQIQRLLHEVQDTLAQPAPRLPWGNRAQATRQRQVLEQVYLYLQQCLTQVEENAAGSQAQTTMQAVLDEMNALRSTLLRPLHSEVATLMQQRQALIREVRQLEAHRQLIQPLMIAAPQARIEHDHVAQDLNAVDTTLHRMFESLQNDIQAYQASLSQGIDKLHTLGCQSEAIVLQLIDRLATQIEQAASPIQTSNEPTPVAMPYAGTELAHPHSAIALSPATNQRPNLFQELSVDQFAVDVEPITVPTVPPGNGTSSGLEAPPELKLLFESTLASPQSDSNSTAQIQASPPNVDVRSELNHAEDESNPRLSAS